MFFCLLVIALTSPAHAQSAATTTLPQDESAKAPRRWDGQWRFEMGGFSLEHGKDSGAAATFYGDIDFDYRFTPWLRSRLSPRLNVFSSRVQERYDDSGEENRLWMSDGYVALEPVSFFELRGGALNQGYHGTGLLISGLRSFPGAQERLKFKSADLEAALIFQQVIPTSHSLNTEREAQEKLPTFMTQSLLLEGKHADLIEWKSTAGLYDWSNIPAKVVSESRRVGNNGTGDDISNSSFMYAHKGWYFAGEFCFCPKSLLGGVVEFERVHNTQAPGDSADAQLIGVGPRVNIGNIEVDLRYRSFFSEPESTVAAYSKSRFGNTNRRGYNLEANVKFKKEGFTIIVENYQAETINRDVNQRELSIFYLGVETEHVSF